VGFNWTLGPRDVGRHRRGRFGGAHEGGREGHPGEREKLLSSGASSFYRRREGTLEFYDFASGNYLPAPVSPDVISSPPSPIGRKWLRRNAGASLYDIGDGVLCVEFHTKMNAIDADVVTMLMEGVELAEKEFAGMVIANTRSTSARGRTDARFPRSAEPAVREHREDGQGLSRTRACGLRYSERPVVAAPAGMALGGGAEICLGADRVRAAAETYMGLVEVGVGLLRRRRAEGNGGPAPGGDPDGVTADPLPFLRKAFETVGLGKVATSAKEAREMGFLRPRDGITIQRDFLIQDAKNTVLAMNREGTRRPGHGPTSPFPGGRHSPPSPTDSTRLRAAGQISEHDEKIGRKIAWVLTGGDVPPGTRLSEQELLDMEREAFLSLCGEERPRPGSSTC